jgi:hypothetical protein
MLIYRLFEMLQNTFGSYRAEGLLKEGSEPSMPRGEGGSLLTLVVYVGYTNTGFVGDYY